MEKGVHQDEGIGCYTRHAIIDAEGHKILIPSKEKGKNHSRQSTNVHYFSRGYKRQGLIIVRLIPNTKLASYMRCIKGVVT